MNANHGNPVNDEEMAALREQIQRLKDGGMSWSALAKESDIPSSTFSSWLNGKYAGDNGEVAIRVRQYLHKRADRSQIRGLAPEAPSFVETETAKTILRRVKYAHALNDLALIAGGPGVGKSASFKQYSATTPQVVIITGSPSISGVQPVLRELVDALRIDKGQGTPQALSKSVRERLDDTDYCVIVDEAQHLSDKAIEELRSIHDATGVAMVLGGNEELYARFAGTSDRAVHAQVRSRIGTKITVLKPSDKDVQVLAEAWSIDDEAAIATLREIANTPGALRGVTKVLRLATMLLNEDEGETGVTDAHVRMAWSQLSIMQGKA
jgi:DNA transposition AAA+ family ATPase